MTSVADEYQKLVEQKAVAIVPGTPVPGHGVTADTITATDSPGVVTTGMFSDAISFGVIGEDTTGVAADTVDPKVMHSADSVNSSVKPDEVDPKAIITGEKMNSVGDGPTGNSNTEGTVQPPIAVNFANFSRLERNYLLAEEFASNVTVIKTDGGLYQYDPVLNICNRIINKPSAKGGNITKLVRDNVEKSHSIYVSDSVGGDIYSWLLDSDDFSTIVEKFDLPNLVLFNNGFFDLAENCFVKCNSHTLGFYFSTKVNALYVETPMAPLSLEFFTNVCREGKNLVLAANGILLSHVRDLKKAFFWSGPRNSGKTTMGNYTSSLIVPKSDYIVRAVPLSRIGGRFSPSAFVDAHFSWAGDIGATEFTRSAFDNFKILTGMDRFEAEGKYKDLRVTEPKCGLSFNCNKFPRFPLAWDYDGDDLDEGAGRNRIALFHTQQTVTDEMRIAYKRKHGMTLEKVLEADRNAIASEMIRQAGRVYRGELLFPKAPFDEVYSEGKSLRERFFYFIKTNYEPTENPADVVPLQELIAGYEDTHPEEFLPYRDEISKQRAFGALLSYVSSLDKKYVQAKKQVTAYPNPVSCLIGCRRKTNFQDHRKADR